MLIQSTLLSTLVPGTPSIDAGAKHFSKREPSLAALYAHLRDETKPPGSSRRPDVDAQAEREMVTYSAKMYNRMGCSALARAFGMSLAMPPFPCCSRVLG